MAARRATSAATLDAWGGCAGTALGSLCWCGYRELRPPWHDRTWRVDEATAAAEVRALAARGKELAKEGEELQARIAQLTASGRGGDALHSPSPQADVQADVPAVTLTADSLEAAREEAAAEAAGPPLGLWVAYLSSYQGMGRAAVHCAGACECSALIDAHRPDVRGDD